MVLWIYHWLEKTTHATSEKDWNSQNDINLIFMKMQMVFLKSYQPVDARSIPPSDDRVTAILLST